MRWSLLALLLLSAGSVRAQEAPAPPFEDSILALFQDPADHQGQDVVMLLEDGYFRVESEGTTVRRTRQVAQILTDEGAAAWGEFSFQYNSVRDRITLDWLRVIEDGEVVQDGPAHQQTSTASVDQSAPIYSDMRILQATLARVRPGTIVDYSVTIETLDPRQPGDFHASWILNGLAPVLRARYVVDAPEGFALNVKDEFARADFSEAVEDGRHLRTWVGTDMEPIEIEPFAGLPSEVLMTIDVGPGVEWSDVGLWYSRFLPDVYELSEELIEAHEGVIAEAKTLRDSLDATYRWVAQDFRYVSLALGDGGYQARLPQEVFETGFGDCKDKTMLFVALANRMGLSASPVLVHSEGEVEEDLPSLTQFDHLIASLEFDGDTSYLDLTTPYSPFGETPGYLQGESGLVVGLDGAVDFVTLPAPDPAENSHVSVVRGALDDQNRFVGSVTYSTTGSEQYWLRSQFYDYSRLSRRDRDELLRMVAGSVWESATVDSSRVFDGRDLNAPAEVTVWFTVTDVMGAAGDRLLLNLPIPGYADPATIATLRDDEERRFPIDIAQVNSPSVYRNRAEISVPPRWVADLPDDVSVEGDFGYYRASFEQEGQTIVLEREMGGLRGIAPPEKAPELLAWFEGVAEDDASYLLINPEGPVVETAQGEEELALAGILPTVEDLGTGVALVGDGESSETDFTSFSMSESLRSHAHDFAAEEMVFSLGESDVALLTVSATEYNTHLEAEKDLRVFEFLDVGALMGGAMAAIAGDQASVGDVDELRLRQAGDYTKAWSIEMVTPFGSMDLVVGTLAKGRVSATLMAVASGGVRAEDFEPLFVLIGDRIDAQPSYTQDLEFELATTSELDSLEVLERADGYPMERMLLGPDDVPGMRIGEDQLDSEGFHTLVSRRLTSLGFTTTVGESRFIDLDIDLVLTDSEGRALKRLVEARQASESDFRDALGDTDDLDVLPGITVRNWDIERNPDFDSPAVTAVGDFGPMGVEVSVAMFAVGRFLVRLRTSSPEDDVEEDDLLSLASRMRDRIVELAPDVLEFTADRDAIREVEHLIDVEEEAAKLYRDDDFEDFLDLIEKERPSEGLATLEPWLWNNVCWWGALYGRASEVLYACDLALEHFEDSPSRRDSRGLARALTGDFEGAIADFEYVVEYGTEQLKATRTPFLEALRQGENPFTEEVLQQLRDEG